MSHEYVLSMADLAGSGYRVVFYDQLGVGKSELPKNRRLFIVERYVEEVEAFREALDLGKIHLWGSSWGGFLGIAYALKYQHNLKSLVSAGGASSTPLTYRGMLKLKVGATGSHSDHAEEVRGCRGLRKPGVPESHRQLYRRHVCRLAEWPPGGKRCLCTHQ